MKKLYISLFLVLSPNFVWANGNYPVAGKTFSNFHELYDESQKLHEEMLPFVNATIEERRTYSLAYSSELTGMAYDWSSIIFMLEIEFQHGLSNQFNREALGVLQNYSFLLKNKINDVTLPNLDLMLGSATDTINLEYLKKVKEIAKREISLLDGMNDELSIAQKNISQNPIIKALKAKEDCSEAAILIKKSKKDYSYLWSCP